jgi:hypothetical protein
MERTSRRSRLVSWILWALIIGLVVWLTWLMAQPDAAPVPV